MTITNKGKIQKRIVKVNLKAKIIILNYKGGSNGDAK